MCLHGDLVQQAAGLSPSETTVQQAWELVPANALPRTWRVCTVPGSGSEVLGMSRANFSSIPTKFPTQNWRRAV